MAELLCAVSYAVRLLSLNGIMIQYFPFGTIVSNDNEGRVVRGCALVSELLIRKIIGQWFIHSGLRRVSPHVNSFTVGSVIC